MIVTRSRQMGSRGDEISVLDHLVINTGLCSAADSVALIVDAAQRLPHAA